MWRSWQFIKSVLKHWGVLVTGGLIIGILSILQGTGHTLSPWVYRTVGIVALFAAFFKAWNDQVNEKEEIKRQLEIERVPAKAVIGHSQWKQMASDFEKLPKNIRADWTGQIGGDVPMLTNRWYIAGGHAAKQCEALCKFAGAMLLHSPRTSPALSATVRIQTNHAWRWLYFLREREGVSDTIMGTGVDHGIKVVSAHQSIENLASVSARVSMELSAEEL